MTMTSDKMSAWGRNFLREMTGENVADDAVIVFEEDSWDDGYCETCSYIRYVVNVSDGRVTEQYDGTLSDLLYDMNYGEE